MTVFYHQRLNRTRATSSWSDESLMIEFESGSTGGQFLPAASRGLNFCSSSAALVCRFFSQLGQKLGQMLSHKWAEVSNTPIMASHCDLIGSDMHGRKRFEHTLASRPLLARRFQLNQGALSLVEFDRAGAARRKQSL